MLQSQFYSDVVPPLLTPKPLLHGIQWKVPSDDLRPPHQVESGLLAAADIAAIGAKTCEGFVKDGWAGAAASGAEEAALTAVERYVGSAVSIATVPIRGPAAGIAAGTLIRASAEHDLKRSRYLNSIEIPKISMMMDREVTGSDSYNMALGVEAEIKLTEAYLRREAARRASFNMMDDANERAEHERAEKAAAAAKSGGAMDWLLPAATGLILLDSPDDGGGTGSSSSGNPTSDLRNLEKMFGLLMLRANSRIRGQLAAIRVRNCKDLALRCPANKINDQWDSSCQCMFSFDADYFESNRPPSDSTVTRCRSKSRPPS